MKVKCWKTDETFELDDSLILGSGGEGTVYQLPQDNSRVIKIYKKQIDDEQVAKLKVMLAHPPLDHTRKRGHASIAWPEDLVSLAGDERVVGFVMPRLQEGRPLTCLYDPSERQKLFPQFTYGSLCRVAANLVSAAWGIHEMGYVIGDVKDANVMVIDSGLVTLVDTDSFQIRDPETNRVYRCPVVTKGFAAPELFGQDCADFDRSPAQDLFAIGILIFQLLMDGQLPFACAFPNVDNPPDYDECIWRGYFPYGPQATCTPPPLAPPFSMLPPLLQDLFIRCFVDGHVDPMQRPTAKTWFRALKQTEDTLRCCGVNDQHVYFEHYKRCPWCERDSFFNQNGASNFDPFAAPHWATHASGPSQQPSPPPFASPRQPAAPPSIPRATPPPVPPAASATSFSVHLPPLPEMLKEPWVELDSLIPLRVRQLDLRSCFSLRKVSLRMRQLLSLKAHLSLLDHCKLNPITVKLHPAGWRPSTTEA